MSDTAIKTDAQIKETLKNQLSDFDKNNLRDNPSSMRTKLIETGIPYRDALMICYIFDCSYIDRYLKKEELSIVEVNNCLEQIVIHSNINRVEAKRILSIILYIYGFNAVAEEFDKIQVSQISKKVKDFDLIKPQFEDNNHELEIIERCVDKEDVASLEKTAHVLEQCVMEGDAYALFIKGKCYLYGIGTIVDKSQARKLLERSAQKGFAMANSLLGDLEYESENYTKAYNYYTGIGAVALSNEKQNRVLAIINNKKTNKKMYVGSIIIFVLTILFNILMAKGYFCPSACTHYPSGIISIILTTVINVLIGVMGFLRKYDSPRKLLLYNVIIVSLFSFISLVI